MMLNKIKSLENLVWENNLTFHRSGRLRKLSGDQITLPTTVDFSSVSKQVSDVQESHTYFYQQYFISFMELVFYSWWIAGGVALSSLHDHYLFAVVRSFYW